MRPAMAFEPCWKCGSSGHLSHDCPRHLTPEQLRERLDRLAKIAAAALAAGGSAPTETGT